MDLLKLQYFMVVAEQRNFTKAAKITYTSQSNISKQIMQLEEELGVELFDRKNVGVEPTAAAKYMYEGLSHLIPQLDKLFLDIKEIDLRKSYYVIRLGICDSMDLERIFPGFLLKLKSLPEELEVRIESYPIEKLVEKLAVGALDCIFLFNVIEANIPTVKRMELTRENPLLYYSHTHRLYGKPNLTIMDFKEEPFVRADYKGQWYDQYQVLPFTPAMVIEANSATAAFSYVEIGAAVAVFGQSQSLLGKDTIATLEIPTEEQKVGADAIWSANNNNPAIPLFIEFLKKCRSMAALGTGDNI